MAGSIFLAARVLARSSRPTAHSRAKSAATAASPTASPCSTHSKRSAKPCLQGNFRLGQLHLHAGSVRSTVTW